MEDRQVGGTGMDVEDLARRGRSVSLNRSDDLLACL